jgi:hypothetical protein
MCKHVCLQYGNYFSKYCNSQVTGIRDSNIGQHINKVEIIRILVRNQALGGYSPIIVSATL